MPTRNVVLTDHHEKLVKDLVASGRYQNASEVLRDGLRMLERQEEVQRERLRLLDAAIAEGERAIEEGRYVTLRSSEDIDNFVRGLMTKQAAE